MSTSYQRAVQWIADNDEPTIEDWRDMSGLLTVLLVADMFGKDERDVARDVVVRRIHQKGAHQ